MRINPADATYARGKQIQFSIMLTNGLAGPCQISRLPEGGLTVLSLTRDNVAITPTLVRGTTVAGFANLLRANLVPLGSGATMSVPWASEGGSSPEDRAALRTSTMDDMDQPMLAFWPIGEPGRYELSLRYAPPPLPAGPADACPASADPARATFTVTGG
ncbi:MAG: hypothetical protein ACM30G_09770 [Micromonosporaceae bacterium]